MVIVTSCTFLHSLICFGALGTFVPVPPGWAPRSFPVRPRLDRIDRLPHKCHFEPNIEDRPEGCDLDKSMGYAKESVKKPDLPRYRLWRAFYPLEGGPQQVPLHVAVVVEEVPGNSTDEDTWPFAVTEQKPVRVSGDDNGDVSRRSCERLVLFDFLPLRPTAFKTTVQLLSGMSVEGNVRERELRFRPTRSQYLGPVARRYTLEDMRQFAMGYPLRLHLVTNSCVTFANKFVERHLE
ncbi:unnamed protein product [Discosporangium mesarthrocarpum]